MSRLTKILLFIASGACLLQTGCFEKLEHGFSVLPNIGTTFSLGGLIPGL